MRSFLLMVRLFRTILLLAAMLALPAAAADRVALVIGNGDYVSEAPLPNPTNDARDIAAALTKHGFAVTIEVDLTKAEMAATLRAFRHKADAAEVALVYYSGHGIAVDGKNYLIPTDARLADERDIERETIGLDGVIADISGAGTLAMVVMDACRNNPFMRSMKRAVARRDITRGTVRVTSSYANTIVAFAADEGDTTPDGEPGTNSPYTAAFLAALAEPPMGVRELLGVVKEEARKRLSASANPAVYDFAGRLDVVLNTRATTVVAQPPRPSLPDREAPPVTPAERDAMMRTIMRYWNAGPLAGREVEPVQIRVVFSRAGELLDLFPIKSPGWGQAEELVVQSARRAILSAIARKTLMLPPAEKYAHWKAMVLTFDPRPD